MLGWALDIWLVFQQFLDAEQDLFDGDVRLPIFLVIQNAEPDSAGRVDVRVGQHRLEHAFGGSE